MNTCTNSPWCEPGQRCKCDAYLESVRKEEKKKLRNFIIKYIIAGIILFSLGAWWVESTMKNDLWMLENCTGNSQETFTCNDTGEYDS